MLGGVTAKFAATGHNGSCVVPPCNATTTLSTANEWTVESAEVKFCRVTSSEIFASTRIAVALDHRREPRVARDACLDRRLRHGRVEHHFLALTGASSAWRGQ
jgi:hypothetical protein